MKPGSVLRNARTLCRLSALPLLLAGQACADSIGAGAPNVANASESRHCGANGETAILVLGSGGPMHGGGRGSAAYLLLHEGRPVTIVDMGGDTPTALARAGVRTDRMGMLMISHLHPDHVSGLPDFLWGEMVAGRDRPLTLVGPSGSATVPALDTFLERSFGADGAFPFMAGLFDGDPFELKTKTVDVDARRPQAIAELDSLRFHALGVPHGSTPALAFRADGPDFRVLFAGDQTARLEAFTRFSADADILVVHAMLTPHAANSTLADVVALPGDLGRQASEAEVRHLVLGHLMGGRDGEDDVWSLASMDELISGIRDHYSGMITVASDGRCIALRRDSHATRSEH